MYLIMFSRISSRIGNHRFGGTYRNYDLLSFDFFGNVYLGSMDIGFNGNSINKTHAIDIIRCERRRALEKEPKYLLDVYLLLFVS